MFTIYDVYLSKLGGGVFVVLCIGVFGGEAAGPAEKEIDAVGRRGGGRRGRRPSGGVGSWSVQGFVLRPTGFQKYNNYYGEVFFFSLCNY